MRLKNEPNITRALFDQTGTSSTNDFKMSTTSRGNGSKKSMHTTKSTAALILHIIKTESRILYVMSTIILFLGIVCIIGLVVDTRTLRGVNVWLKPLKFAISIALYVLTFGYLITKYPYSKLKKNIINHITAWSLLFEFVIIFYQAARGVSSHYNTATLFDGISFMLMGIFIGIIVLLNALFIIDTIRLKLRTTKPMQWAILLGWLTIFFGSWVGGQMIGQLSHNVGVADGGAGLPLVNWSTTGGDLRIAHFFAIHGLQIIPLFAVWVSKKWTLETRYQTIAISIFAALFAFCIGSVFYQAKQGIALIAQ